MARLTRIYTRTGDDGETGLADGSRLRKSAPRVAALGDVDELNGHLGLIAAGLTETTLQARIIDVQHALFDLGGELAIPGVQLLTLADIQALEADIDGWNATLPVLQEFILPGGSLAVAQCHVARAVCRRAERSLAVLAETETLPGSTTAYINRLSDWLFVLARVIARHEGRAEIYWSRERRDRARSGTRSDPD